MSRRFGRNQKRKMREEIADLRVQIRRGYSREDRLARRSEDAESRIISWARIIHAELGPEHPLNEKIQSQVVRALPYIDEIIRYYDRSRPLGYQAIEKALYHLEVASRYIEAVTHQIQVQPDKFSFSVRCILESQDGASAFVIDRHELEKGRRDPRFVDWVAIQISRNLARHLERAA